MILEINLTILEQVKLNLLEICDLSFLRGDGIFCLSDKGDPLVLCGDINKDVLDFISRHFLDLGVTDPFSSGVTLIFSDPLLVIMLLD